MKNIFRIVLALNIGTLFTITSYGQGSGSTHGGGGRQEYRPTREPAFESREPAFRDNDPFNENRSFEVTKSVRGNLVKFEEGLLSIKTTKGELLNLAITPQTKIKSKKDNYDFSKGKLVKVTYLPEKLLKKELEAVRIKILN